MVGDGRTGEAGARALSKSLQVAGNDTVNMGRGEGAGQIAASATELRADAVELRFTGPALLHGPRWGGRSARAAA
jgi:hypothetical protein